MEIGQGSSTRSQQDHREHGRQQPAHPARHRLQRRRQLRQRQRHHADAGGRRGHPSANAPPSTASPPCVRARTQVVYGNKNWVPDYIYGTTPDVPRRPRLGGARRGRAASPTATCRNASRVCLVGQTLVRELFGGESPDRQGDPRPERHLPRRRRPEPARAPT